LLTAALIGAAIGASATLLLRRPQRVVPRRGVIAAAGAGARRAGQGARRAAEQLHPDELRDHLHRFVESARDAINDAVADEIRDLRKSVRRQRKKLGI
jgi:gas vesicle protein